MDRRLELQAILVELLGSDNVYFQPPPDFKMQYPCIRYERDYAKTEFADNAPFRHEKRYLVTHIARDPDSGIPDQIAELPMCVFDRFFVADGLNHDVYKLFF
jgi:hypothetical protein